MSDPRTTEPDSTRIERTDVRVTDNPHESRYELWVGDTLVSLADYRLSGNVVTVPHVETQPAYGGRGCAAMLMDGMLDDLRTRSLTIRPTCPFAAAHIRDHPDTHDLYAA